MWHKLKSKLNIAADGIRACFAFSLKSTAGHCSNDRINVESKVFSSRAEQNVLIDCTESRL